jgi:hypothetical protein
MPSQYLSCARCAGRRGVSAKAPRLLSDTGEGQRRRTFRRCCVEPWQAFPFLFQSVSCLLKSFPCACRNAQPKRERETRAKLASNVEDVFGAGCRHGTGARELRLTIYRSSGATLARQQSLTHASAARKTSFEAMGPSHVANSEAGVSTCTYPQFEKKDMGRNATEHGRSDAWRVPTTRAPALRPRCFLRRAPGQRRRRVWRGGVNACRRPAPRSSPRAPTKARARGRCG